MNIVFAIDDVVENFYFFRYVIEIKSIYSYDYLNAFKTLILHGIESIH